MTRNLVLCIDGTWNSPAEQPHFASLPTNVERISQLLTNDGRMQRVIYRPGVGTQGFGDQVTGGVWGAGSTKRICDGYRLLCDSYQAGDRVALFGFSRGAFAVRAIVGVLARIGILRSDQLHEVQEAVSLYRRPLWLGDSKLQSFRKTYCHDVKPEIVFVGVWDTVIMYGPVFAPARILLELTLRHHFGLFDQRIPFAVRHLRHALALDEQRAVFWPWRARCQESLPTQVEEVWFAGSHSDIGGGYCESRPAEFPLQWISEGAARAGLLFNQMPSVSEDSHRAPLNPSRVGPWRILSARRRIVEDSDHLHYSVEQRVRATGYRPTARLPKQMLDRLKCVSSVH